MRSRFLCTILLCINFLVENLILNYIKCCVLINYPLTDIIVRKILVQKKRNV